MIRTQVYLTPKQHRGLKRQAAREGISMTELLRRVLDAHLEAPSSRVLPSKESILSFVGLGESDRDDVSEIHDQALSEALRAGPPR
jgi:hypothetical protein